jgi:hypothetical protein
VTRRFQSCWDGSNIDSANHRTPVAFAGADGSCPAGFRAVPQLVQRIVYDVDAPSLRDGGKTTPLFAVDSFPEQLHKAVTDHGDFINVFDESLMRQMVDCINGGRTCGSGQNGGGNDGDGGNGGGNDGNRGNDGNGGKGGNGNAGDNASGDAGGAGQGPPPTVSAPAQAQAQSQAEPPTDTGAVTGGIEQQAVQGGLAETGADLWPGALGALLVIAGFVVLRRTARRN